MPTYQAGEQDDKLERVYLFLKSQAHVVATGPKPSALARSGRLAASTADKQSTTPSRTRRPGRSGRRGRYEQIFSWVSPAKVTFFSCKLPLDSEAYPQAAACSRAYELLFCQFMTRSSVMTFLHAPLSSAISRLSCITRPISQRFHGTGQAAGSNIETLPWQVADCQPGIHIRQTPMSAAAQLG